MRWALLVAGLVVVVGAACSGSGSPTTMAAPTATAPPVPRVTTTVASITQPGPTTPEGEIGEALDVFVAAISAGDAGAAFEVLASDATLSFGEAIEVQLGQPLPVDLEWIPGALGVGESSAEAVVQGVIGYLAATRTRPSVTDCEASGASLRCTYTSVDALTQLLGTRAPGSITVEAVDGRIGHLRLPADFAPDLAAAPDAFWRWAMLDTPDVAREMPLVDMAGLVVRLADAWEAAGRPDVASAAQPDSDPETVVSAFLAARNGGDWDTMVALMGGEALLDPFGSRDEFDAAQVLDRDFTTFGCEATLVSAARGTRIACRLTVTDIIVATAGIGPTNPNQSTFQVLDGRVTGLPQFVPSSFLAETAVEEWAAANAPGDYAAACPEGIAGQSTVDGLACARFIAANRTAWEPLVAAVGG